MILSIAWRESIVANGDLVHSNKKSYPLRVKFIPQDILKLHIYLLLE